jgi:hypothetical protein
MSTIRENKHPSCVSFGFDEIMAAANFDRFPAWYAERCLSPNGFKQPLPAIETAEPAVEFYALSKKAA